MSKIPLGLYSLDVKTSEELESVLSYGWNLGHSYHSQESLGQTLEKSKVGQIFYVGSKDAQNIKNSEMERKKLLSEIDKLKFVSWWGLPEEMRHWKKDEMQTILNWSQDLHANDPLKRPVFMYMPCHYNRDDVSQYVPYLDIIGVGGYNEYKNMPRAWTRFRIEETLAGIKKAGYQIGTDFNKKQRLPICVLGLFTEKGTVRGITPQAAIHDVFSCISNGALGILVFSYFHRNDPPGLKDSFLAYSRAVKFVSENQKLMDTVLDQQRTEIEVSVTEGPKRTEKFHPEKVKSDIDYPSLQAVLFGEKYLITINSTNSRLSGEIKLPKGNWRQVFPSNGKQASFKGKLKKYWASEEVSIYQSK